MSSCFISSEMLLQFTGPEELQEEVFVCDQCKSDRQPAIKQLSISQLPEVHDQLFFQHESTFILYFPRFSDFI